jgi:hypothetical protein
VKVTVIELLVGSVLVQLQLGMAAPWTLQVRHPFASHVAQFGLHSTHSPSITLVLVPATVVLVLKGFKKNPALQAKAIVGLFKPVARHFC